MDPDAQRVIDAAPGLLTWLPLDDGDGPGGLLPAQEVFGPAPGVDRRVDQLGAGVGFGERRDLSSSLNGLTGLP
ncbi:MAG: hypothetical protein M1118_12600 [Chloroflexi bacterium]|nr:hypothetical protein [Chloroflexota bacterium]